MSALAVRRAERPAKAPFANRKPVPTPVRPEAGQDGPLIARMRMGDEHAFNELMEKYHGALMRRALRYVDSRDVAEEVVQDTWIAVIDGIQNFAGRSLLSTWIFSILINQATNRGALEGGPIHGPALQAYDDAGGEATVDPSRFHASGDRAGHWARPPQPWDAQTPETLLASTAALGALSTAVDQLPQGLRDVIVLKDVEGRATRDICERLRISETDLYARLHRARERVRAAVEKALEGNPPRDVSNCGLATLMATAHAIRRKPCPGNAMSMNAPAGI